MDPCRAEVFSIGLTLLSAGILESCHQIYEGLKVNQHRLEQFLSFLREKYSNYLVSTIASMLSLSPQGRRKASDIYNELYPFENQILDLEPFPESGVNNYMQQQVRPVSYQLPPGGHPYFESRQNQVSSGYQSYGGMNQARR